MRGILLDGKIVDLIQKGKIKWVDFDSRHRSRGILYGGGFRNVKNCDESVVPFYKIFHLDEQYAFDFEEGPAWIRKSLFSISENPRRA
jgi:hypothetical protein